MDNDEVVRQALRDLDAAKRSGDPERIQAVRIRCLLLYEAMRRGYPTAQSGPAGEVGDG